VLAASARAEREVGEVRCRKVVNISSISGLAGTPGQANYSAAKAGLVGLTKALSKEWGRYNITVNTVAFGLITTRLTSAPDGSLIDVHGTAVPVGMNPALAQAATDRIPLGRAVSPQEAARAVYFFCGPDSDYVTGQTLPCSGGAG